MANERIELRNFTGQTVLIKTASGSSIELDDGGTAHIFEPTITVRPAPSVPAAEESAQSSTN